MAEVLQGKHKVGQESKVGLKPTERVQPPRAITGPCAEGAGQEWVLIHALLVSHS